MPKNLVKSTLRLPVECPHGTHWHWPIHPSGSRTAHRRSSAREVSRWLFGNTFKGGVGVPLWKSQLADLDEKVIGFRDLMELRIVKAFRNHDVPLQVIRAAIEGAKVMFGTEYPFTAHRFLTDGKSIFSEALQEHGDSEMTDLAKRQLVFEHTAQRCTPGSSLLATARQLVGFR